MHPKASAVSNIQPFMKTDEVQLLTNPQIFMCDVCHILFLLFAIKSFSTRNISNMYVLRSSLNAAT